MCNCNTLCKFYICRWKLLHNVKSNNVGKACVCAVWWSECFPSAAVHCFLVWATRLNCWKNNIYTVEAEKQTELFLADWEKSHSWFLSVFSRRGNCSVRAGASVCFCRSVVDASALRVADLFRTRFMTTLFECVIVALCELRSPRTAVRDCLIAIWFRWTAGAREKRSGYLVIPSGRLRGHISPHDSAAPLGAHRHTHPDTLVSRTELVWLYADMLYGWAYLLRSPSALLCQ